MVKKKSLFLHWVAVYKKHHPPALDDEVWRLEKIGKGGAFHQKLSSYGINTVQDFLKLYIVDSSKLRTVSHSLTLTISSADNAASLNSFMLSRLG